jgi:hypothetical protein
MRRRVTGSLRTGILVLCIVLVSAQSGLASAAVAPDELLERADLLLRLGVLEKGAGRSFEEAGRLLEAAVEGIEEADLLPADRQRLIRESDAVREDLELLTELYDERFYGVFPLARLISPTMLVDEGLAVSEQLFHPPDVAAVLITTRKLLKLLDRYHHPHVVFRSSPNDRRLENIAADVLLRDGRSTPHLRRALINGLSTEELEAFDRGEITPRLIDQLYTIFDAVSLLTLTVAQPIGIDDGSVIFLRGDFYTPGEVVQGSPVGASPNIRVESFSYLGFTLDRRDQFWPIVRIHLLLFGLALIWAARVRWGIDKSLNPFYRLAIGAALFLFGRVFLIAAVAILGRFTPEATAMVAAAWWWPAVLGLLTIVVGGLVAWLVQAQLTDIVPGARGERAVGSIFALVALGACSFFVAPVLLLDEGRGMDSLIPFFASGVSLAVLFGFAVRTGPPVPTYLAIGPLAMAPVLGVCVFTASPGLLWISAALTALLCLAAWVRHRVALARGTEEAELTEEEAAKADQQRLIKLGEKLKK